MSLTRNLTRNLTRPLTRPITEFQATDFSGNVLWLDASDDTTITNSGDLADNWADKSPSDVDATSSGSQRPSTGVNTINGRNVLTFDDTNSENMLISSFGSFMSGSDKTCTIFSVARHSEAVQQYIYSFGNSASDNSICGIRTTSTTGKYTFVKRDDTATIKGPIGTNDTSLDTPYIIASVIASDGLTVDTYINGTQDIAAGDIDVGTTTIDEFMIGGVPFASGPVATWTGDIGEIIIYNRSLPTEEITQINNYLSNKWGITLS